MRNTRGPAVVSLVVFLSLWELLSHFEIVPRFILPAPSEVFSSLYDDRGELLAGFLQTCFEALCGLALSFVVGTVTAVLLSFSVFLRQAFYPYAIFFQTVPIVAIAPVLVIWFGFGTPTSVACAFICSFFPILASTLLGLTSTEPALLDLFQLYHASRLQKLIKLQWPFALPHIFSGLRISAGLAVIGAIIGEFIAGGGLGSVVDGARTQQRLDKVFSAVLLSSLIGMIFLFVINTLSRQLLKNWHASERG